MKKLLRLLVVLLALGFGLYGFYHLQMGPYGQGANLYFSKGSTVQTLTKDLHDKGVLRNTWVFPLLVRYRGAGAKLQPGEYDFPPLQTPEQVLDRLVKGQRVVHKLLIPEGYNFNQIAQVIEKSGIAPAAEVMAQLKNPALLQKLGFSAPSLEGFLFPATYEYDRGTTLDDLLGRMVQAFLRNYDAAMRERTLAMGWTIPQVVTLASIIEKETGKAEERPRISAVFHNRLRQGMLLQTDPTVIYGLPNFDGNIRKADLQNPHPYNTYVHPGLPPGPIAAPGKASLQAALNPDTSAYLYFVAKGDGSHQFSQTLEEHEAAVAQYQLRKTETQPMATPAPSPHPQ